MSDQDAVAELLDPIRATAFKRQAQAELAQALAGSLPPEPGVDDAALDQLADKLAAKILERLDARMNP